jgi:phosphomannomutase
MAKEKFLHILTVGTTKIGIEEVDNYGSIGSLVGIKKATDTDRADEPGTISQLKRYARIITFTVRTADKKSHKLQCAIDKASSAAGSLIGKAFAGSTIKKVSIARKRTRR